MTRLNAADACLFQIRRLGAEMGAEVVTSGNLASMQYVEMVEKLDELLSTGASDLPAPWAGRTPESTGYPDSEPGSALDLAITRLQAQTNTEQLLQFAARDYASAFNAMLSDPCEATMARCDHAARMLTSTALAIPDS